MPKIHVLDKAVAELIAAGEVVERPSSIVKELIENSVDAGATSITVEIRGGGVRYIRISDNGCGIEREDIPRAFLRHATSKVRSADDLAAIHTLGFRGEALASVAAMCRVELTTKTADETEGTTCRIEGGEMLDSFPAGCPAGTTIIIRDVFFNTPARMKFLKKDISEGNSVAQVVDKCALAHPEIAFRFIRDGVDKLRTSGCDELLSVIRSIYGREIADCMIPVDYNYEGRIRVSGYISRPAGTRPSRTYQNFFINRRYVRTRTGSAALEEGFKNKIMVGKFPACVLNIAIDAETVDVNVHPAKIEVRFVDERPVFHAVYFAVKSALAALDAPLSPTRQPVAESRGPGKINAITMHLPQQEPVQQRMTAGEFRALFGEKEERKPLDINRPVAMRASRLDISVDDDDELAPMPIEPPVRGTEKNLGAFAEKAVKSRENGTILIDKPRPVPQVEAELRLLGEAFATYIILEQGDNLLLVDKHAAHERILYERLKRNLDYGNRQVLLTPQAVTLAKEDYDALLGALDRVAAMGFLLEDFGGATMLVREIPIELGEQDVAGIIGEIADRVRVGNRDLTPEALDRLYYNIACRSAVKAGDRNHVTELDDIIQRLRRNPDITHCPHGRPVVIRLGRREIEKMFGRLG